MRLFFIHTYSNPSHLTVAHLRCRRTRHAYHVQCVCCIWLHMSSQIYINWPVSQYERPSAVALASSPCVDKTTKIITEFTRKDPFFTSETSELVLQKVSSWSKSICVTCKLLMYVYLDIKSLYPHLKVNWNMLMCKICIARCLVVDIFPWCNANFVPFPSGTLVARRMRNGRIHNMNRPAY